MRNRIESEAAGRERAESALRFLAEASGLLSASLDRDVLDLIRETLEGQAFRVEWAPSAAEGLARARTHRPAAIVLDVIFHGDRDGWEVLRALKADPATREIPVVMHSVVDNPRQAKELGAADVLPKPASPEAVRARLCALAARKAPAPPEAHLGAY